MAGLLGLQMSNEKVSRVCLQARIALRMPWWTLTAGFEMVKSMAGLSGDADTIRHLLDESTVNSNLPPGVDVATRTDEQVRISCW